MTKQTLPEKHIIIAVVGAIIIFIIGFFVGSSYMTNQIRGAFSGLGSTSPELTKEKKIVGKKLGDEVDITTMKISCDDF